MVLVHGGNTAIRVPLHIRSGDPVRRLSLGGVGLLDLRRPAQYVRGTHRDDRAGHSRHSRLMAAEGVTASPVLSVDVNASEQGHQVPDLDVLE